MSVTKKKKKTGHKNFKIACGLREKKIKVIIIITQYSGAIYYRNGRLPTTSVSNARDITNRIWKHTKKKNAIFARITIIIVTTFVQYKYIYILYIIPMYRYVYNNDKKRTSTHFFICAKRFWSTVSRFIEVTLYGVINWEAYCYTQWEESVQILNGVEQRLLKMFILIKTKDKYK